MLVFLTIFLTIYALINFYIARRGAQALAGFPALRTVFLAVFIVTAASYPLGKALHALFENLSTIWVDNVGAMHMIFMLYGFLGVVLVDLVRLANNFVRFLPRTAAANPKTGLMLFIALAGATVLTIAAGAWNAAHARVLDLEVHLTRGAGSTDRLTAVVVSDLHLGSLIGRARLEKTVRQIQALDPDIVLIPGDIVDESISKRQEGELSLVMQTLKTRLGVFACPGNHETYAGLDRTLACFRGCGISVLQDQAARVDGAFVLIGRRDPSSLRRGEKRLTVPEILAREGLDSVLPLIVLDHQPSHLEEAEQAGVALQLSGHTHAGQIFPLDIINRWVWELNWGLLTKGETQYYVTSGVGTWGPPVRTGNRPEIVRLRIVFDRAGR